MTISDIFQLAGAYVMLPAVPAMATWAMLNVWGMFKDMADVEFDNR